MLLRMHQIEYLQDGQLPEDLSGALLFSSTQLSKLKRRVHVSHPTLSAAHGDSTAILYFLPVP